MAAYSGLLRRLKVQRKQSVDDSSVHTPVVRPCTPVTVAQQIRKSRHSLKLALGHVDLNFSPLDIREGYHLTVVLGLLAGFATLRASEAAATTHADARPPGSAERWPHRRLFRRHRRAGRHAAGWIRPFYPVFG